MERSGYFVRLVARDETSRCLHDMISAMDSVDAMMNVLALQVVLPAPLVPFLRRVLAPVTDSLTARRFGTRYRHKGERWCFGGLCHGQTKGAVQALVARVLTWKQQARGRDVLVVSVMDIPRPLVATLTRYVHGEEMVLRQLILPHSLERRSDPQDKDVDALGAYDVQEVDTSVPSSGGDKGLGGAWTDASSSWRFVFPRGTFPVGPDIDGEVSAPEGLENEVHIQS